MYHLPFVVKHCTAQNSTLQYRTAPHNTAQHSTVQHSTAQHSTAQHSTALHMPNTAHAQHCTAQYNTAQNSTAQHSTAQHSTAQHNTAQHCTALHSTALHSTAQYSTRPHSTAQHSTAQYSTRPHSTAHIEHKTTGRVFQHPWSGNTSWYWQWRAVYKRRLLVLVPVPSVLPPDRTQHNDSDVCVTRDCLVRVFRDWCHIPILEVLLLQFEWRHWCGGLAPGTAWVRGSCFIDSGGVGSSFLSSNLWFVFSSRVPRAFCRYSLLFRPGIRN